MANLTVQEQLLLELVNRARLDPAGEAARLGIALNEGLAAGRISSAAKQPLASNDALIAAARAHSLHMLNVDQFAHNGIGDGTPSSRTAAAGYVLAGTAGIGENIAFNGTTGAINATLMAIENYENLFIDAGIAGRGHRLNILDPFWREIGTGQETGVFTNNQGSFNSAMLTQDFGRTGTNLFITGVAITDADGDNFYDIGEGRTGITVTISGAGNDTTGTAGGYEAAFTGGTVDVTFSGGALAASVTATVSAGAQNAKVDLAGDNEILSSASVTLGAGAVNLTLLGVAALRGTGNADANVIIGNKGGNTIQGLGGADVLTGGRGRDMLTGGSEADRFDFNAVAESAKTAAARDHITDFVRGTDKIDLSTIDAKTNVAGNQAFTFIAAQAFHHRAGELHFVRSGANVVIEGDTNGDGRADFQIQLDGLTSIAKADFIL